MSVPTSQWEDSRGSHGPFLNLHGAEAFILSKSPERHTPAGSRGEGALPNISAAFAFSVYSQGVLQVQSVLLAPNRRDDFRWDLGGPKSHGISQ